MFRRMLAVDTSASFAGAIVTTGAPRLAACGPLVHFLPRRLAHPFLGFPGN
jgi:hypothetical protein